MTTQTIATLFNRFEPVPTAPIKRGPRVDVLVHRCFSQLDGDAKRHHCVCDEHVTPETAAAMVAMGEADYLASFRNTPLGERPYTSLKTIVIRQTSPQVAHYQEQRFDQIIEKRDSVAAAKREEQSQAQKERLVRRLKRTLNQLYNGNHISSDVCDWAHSHAVEILQNPEVIQDRLGKESFRCVVLVAISYWSQLIDDADPMLKVGQGKLIPGTGHGCGLLMTGGFDSQKLNEIDKFSDDPDNGQPAKKATGANFVPGAEVWSIGQAPDGNEWDADGEFVQTQAEQFASEGRDALHRWVRDGIRTELESVGGDDGPLDNFF